MLETSGVLGRHTDHNRDSTTKNQIVSNHTGAVRIVHVNNLHPEIFSGFNHKEKMRISRYPYNPIATYFFDAPEKHSTGMKMA